MKKLAIYSQFINSQAQNAHFGILNEVSSECVS